MAPTSLCFTRSQPGWRRMRTILPLMLSPLRSRTSRGAAALAVAALCALASGLKAQTPSAWEQLPFPGIRSALDPDRAASTWHPAWAVEVRNVNGGGILLYRPGRTGELLGRVTRPARTLGRAGFHAGSYAADGTVSASSRKILRLRGPNGQGDPSLTLLPEDWARGYESPAERAAIAGEDSARRTNIWTDCMGGLFGQWAPPVGSPVFYHDGERWQPLAEYHPGNGNPGAPERMLIVVFRPRQLPRYLELENWTAQALKAWRSKPGRVATPPEELPTRNGRALASWDEGGKQARPFGTVYQRVQAVGRLDDTGVARSGQICTNHPGNIAISTSAGVSHPVRRAEESEALSGFQVIPANHARDGMVDDRGNAGYAIGHNVWMIVGSSQGNGRENSGQPSPLGRLVSDPTFFMRPPLEGVAPLFAGYLSPRYFAEEDTSDRVPTQRRGNLVRISTDFGATWKRLPTLRATPRNRQEGLYKVTNVRLYLPTLEE